VTPLYPQKLALTSPTGGGRSVGIVRSQTKATEFFITRFNIKKFYILPREYLYILYGSWNNSNFVLRNIK